MKTTQTTWSNVGTLVWPTICTLGLVSLVLWAMGIGATAVSNSVHDHVPTPTLYFYFCGMPMIQTLSSVGELLLFFRDSLSPIVSLVWSLLLLGGWSIMLAFWRDCERAGDFWFNGCPYPLGENYLQTYSLNTPADSASFWAARLAFTGIATLICVVYLGISAAAVHKNRIAGAQQQSSTEMHPRKRLSDDAS